MTWRTAIALDEYRAEVNRRFPNRSKASDGTIGDNAHAGQGQGSDHNPWVMRNGVGVVRAFDLTHDPRNGVDCEKLSDYLFEMGKAGDPRLRNGGYLIFNDWITNPDWQSWRRYGGSNPHTSHMHVSFSTDYFDNRGDWSKSFGPVSPSPIVPPQAPGGFLMALSDNQQQTILTAAERINGVVRSRTLPEGQVDVESYPHGGAAVLDTADGAFIVGKLDGLQASIDALTTAIKAGK